MFNWSCKSYIQRYTVYGNECEARSKQCLTGSESHTYCDTVYIEQNVKIEIKMITQTSQRVYGINHIIHL